MTKRYAAVWEDGTSLTFEADPEEVEKWLDAWTQPVNLTPGRGSVRFFPVRFRDVLINPAGLRSIAPVPSATAQQDPDAYHWGLQMDSADDERPWRQLVSDPYSRTPAGEPFVTFAGIFAKEEGTPPDEQGVRDTAEEALAVHVDALRGTIARLAEGMKRPCIFWRSLPAVTAIDTERVRGFIGRSRLAVVDVFG